jgi:hypothetical protein
VLAGERLLTEWTSIDDPENKAVLAARTDRQKRFAALCEQLKADKISEEEFTEQYQTFVTAERASMGSIVLNLRKERRDQLNKGPSKLKTKEFFEVRAKHAKHIAKCAASDGEFRDALRKRGLLADEVEIVGEQAMFVSAQAKQANLDKWHQWHLFTTTGMLRKESGGQLTGQLQALEGGVKAGTDKAGLEAAKASYQATLEELNRRTDKFMKTAEKYRSRVRKLVEVLLAIIIGVSTMGLATLGTLVVAAINLAIELVKTALLTGFEELLAPGASGGLGEITMASIRAVLMAGVTLGMGMLTSQLQQSFNLIDANGLRGGTYVLEDGTVITSDAIKSGSGLLGVTPKGWATNLGCDMIIGGINYVNNKVIKTATDVLPLGVKGALKQLGSSFSLVDVIRLGFQPVVTDFFQRAGNEALMGVNAPEKELVTNDAGQQVLASQLMDTSKVAGYNENFDWSVGGRWYPTLLERLTNTAINLGWDLGGRANADAAVEAGLAKAEAVAAGRPRGSEGEHKQDDAKGEVTTTFSNYVSKSKAYKKQPTDPKARAAMLEALQAIKASPHALHAATSWGGQTPAELMSEIMAGIEELSKPPRPSRAHIPVSPGAAPQPPLPTGASRPPNKPQPPLPAGASRAPNKPQPPLPNAASTPAATAPPRPPRPNAAALQALTPKAIGLPTNVDDKAKRKPSRVPGGGTK